MVDDRYIERRVCYILVMVGSSVEPHQAIACEGFVGDVVYAEARDIVIDSPGSQNGGLVSRCRGL